MSDSSQNPSDRADQPALEENHTDNLGSLYVYFDVVCQMTRRPARGPIVTQTRPNPPPPPLPPEPGKDERA